MQFYEKQNQTGKSDCFSDDVCYNKRAANRILAAFGDCPEKDESNSKKKGDLFF
jgi:hypothetical protein